MPSETEPTFAFGDVVLVTFPFTNQTASKKRPAVVVSSTAYNGERPDVVLMAITSQMRPSPSFGEVWLQDWKKAGLLKPSAVKPLLATLEQALINRKLGALSTDDERNLVEALTRILGGTTVPSLEPSLEKIDEAMLALLLLGLHDQGRVWKSFDWDALERLYERGYISDPKSKAKSVALTDEGQRRAEHLFDTMFGKR